MQTSFNLGKVNPNPNNFSDSQYTIGSNYGNNPLEHDSDSSSQSSSSIISSNYSSFNTIIAPPAQMSKNIPIMGMIPNKNSFGPPPSNFGQISNPQILVSNSAVGLPKVQNPFSLNSYNNPLPPNMIPGPPVLYQPNNPSPFPKMNPPPGLEKSNQPNNPVLNSFIGSQQKFLNSANSSISNQSGFPPPSLPSMYQSNIPPPPNATKMNQNFLPTPPNAYQSMLPPGLPQNPSNMKFSDYPQPNLPGMNAANFPPSSVNVSIQRVSISEKNIVSANNDGRLNSIINNNPSVQLYSNSAGPDQAYINVVGPIWSVEKAVKTLETLEPNQDDQWCFLDDDGNFRKYPADQNPLIEKSFKRGDPTIDFIGSNQVSYTIIYGQNNNPHQQIVRDGTVYRTVRRGTKAPNLSFAAHDITAWYWADEIENRWKTYEPEACVLISSHYNDFKTKFKNTVLSKVPDKKKLAKSEAVLVYGKSGFAYLIDFVNMVQLNEKTRRWRSIKLEGMSSEFRVSRSDEPIPWIDHPELP